MAEDDIVKGFVRLSQGGFHRGPQVDRHPFGQAGFKVFQLELDSLALDYLFDPGGNEKGTVPRAHVQYPASWRNAACDELVNDERPCTAVLIVPRTDLVYLVIRDYSRKARMYLSWSSCSKRKES
jgi:hypothetical protein